MGMRLLAHDDELRESISRKLDAARKAPGDGRRRATSASAADLAGLVEQRRKLLHLHYDGRISADQFGEEQARLTLRIEALQGEIDRGVQQANRNDDISARFEEVARLLQDLDIDRLWREATESEKRALVDELVDNIAVLPDHLEVSIAGAPTINVLLSEVGLRDSENSRVGGGV